MFQKKNVLEKLIWKCAFTKACFGKACFEKSCSAYAENHDLQKVVGLKKDVPI